MFYLVPACDSESSKWKTFNTIMYFWSESAHVDLLLPLKNPHMRAHTAFDDYTSGSRKTRDRHDCCHP